LAHLRNKPEEETKHRTAALRHWPTNPEVDHLIGQKLSQKYRFAEGEKYQRQALAFDPSYLPAKLQLSQDLLRLGQEDEGWQLAGSVNELDAYNVVAHNLVTLQENLAKFRTLEEDGLVVRMDAREAEIYGHRVLDLLKRARQTLCAKFDVQLPGPVIVEMFPRQQDFAIRTFGLPGGSGFLGVCFGTVITANSPASQGENPSCWEATLWHEFCHVVTLSKTKNKMPRWLSEGISVYEERLADPTWGQSFAQTRAAFLVGYALVGKFLATITESDPEVEAAVGNQIDRGSVFRDTHGIVQWQQDEERTDADPCRTRGHRTSDRQQRRRVAIVNEMVFGQPRVVVAERFGIRDEIELRAVHVLPRYTIEFRVSKRP
jgi:hypothetical protein